MATSAFGTKRTNGTGLTMSVLEGKADFPGGPPRLLSLTLFGHRLSIPIGHVNDGHTVLQIEILVVGASIRSTRARRRSKMSPHKPAIREH